MSNEVSSLDAQWRQSIAVNGPDHPETRYLESLLEQARVRQRNEEQLSALRDHQEREQKAALTAPSQPSTRPANSTPSRPSGRSHGLIILAVVMVLAIVWLTPKQHDTHYRSPEPDGQSVATRTGPKTPPSISQEPKVPAPAPATSELSKPLPRPTRQSYYITQPRNPIPPAPQHYGSVRDDLIRPLAELETYLHVLLTLALADNKPDLSRCLLGNAFTSPASMTKTVDRLWIENAPSLEAAVDQALVAPCEAGILSPSSTQEFPPRKSKGGQDTTGHANDALRIYGAIRAMSHYARKYANSPQAADCIDRRREELKKQVPTIYDPGPYLPLQLHAYNAARSLCGFLPNAPDGATLLEQAPDRANFVQAAELRHEIAQRLHKSTRINQAPNTK